MLKYTGFLSLSLFISFCGFNESKNEKSESKKPLNPLSDWGEIYVLESDSLSGQLLSKFMDSTTFGKSSLKVHPFSKLYKNKGTLYILEKKGADNLIRLNVTPEAKDVMVYKTHLREGGNPSGIAFYNKNKAYISLEDVPEVLVFDLITGKVLKSIDLSPYIYQPDTGVAARSPHAVDICLARGMVYVLLQRRQNEQGLPSGPSQIVSINPLSDTIEGEFPLNSYNGQKLIADSVVLYVSSIGKGQWGELGDGGGIQKIDLLKGSSQTIVTDTDLGGDPMSMVKKWESYYFVTVYKNQKDIQIKHVDYETSEVYALFSEYLQMAFCFDYDELSSFFYMCTKDSNGVNFTEFDYDGNILNEPLKGDLFPYDILVLDSLDE